MPRRVPVLFLAASLAGGPMWSQTLATVTDAEVTKGIRQVEDGDYDAAIFTLDAATRRLAADPSHPPDLPQAYLYLGVAFVGKGHEAAAKAKFRQALHQLRELSLDADKFPPKVINIFEAAREETAREEAGPSATKPTPTPTPAAKKGGGGKGLWILGGLAVVGGGVAIAAAGGSKSGQATVPSGGLTTTMFPNEVVVFGGGRDFMIVVTGSGTLTARVAWQPDGVVLGMYIVNLANPSQVLADGGQTAVKEVSLSFPVTAGSYRVSVTNSTGAGPHVDTTFTLTVIHP